MRTTARRAMVAALAAAVLIGLLPAPARAADWLGVFAVAPQTETCLAIPASGGSIPAQVTCVDSMNHLWNFTQIDVGLYHIASLGSAGNCLAGSGSSVFLTSCFYGAAGQWRLTGRGNTFRVANAGGGGCLNRSGATDVVLGTCGTNSLWQLLY